MSVLYQVNLCVDSSICDEYILWLKEHIEQMLQIDGFIKADLYRR